MSTAFFAWNPFQIFQAEAVAAKLDDAVYLIERRPNIDFDRIFSAEFLKCLNAPVEFIDRGDMKKLEGRFDALVCQTPFAHIERLNRTKIIGLQYSMSKERHQYGSWRAICDLNLVYGEYSRQRIEPFSPCRVVGNPRFDRWFDDKLDPVKLAIIKSRLQPDRKTVLYLPTWGRLSSMSDFGKAIADLSDSYNVIAKVHHNTDSHELNRKGILGQSGLNAVFGASDDLLYLFACADVILSDFSGAIFDAINIGKPVILLQKDAETLDGVEKFGLESIEYVLRHQIGEVLSHPAALRATVDSVIEGRSDFCLKNDALRRLCFEHQKDCGGLAAAAITELKTRKISRPAYQVYLRDDLKAARFEQQRAEVIFVKKVVGFFEGAVNKALKKIGL